MKEKKGKKQGKQIKSKKESKVNWEREREREWVNCVDDENTK